MASTSKRCHYEVLGLSRDCTQDEIRSAYKKLALQRHPDKLIQSGLTEFEATAQFQELVQAYEVLSDPKERSWYDSHRSQILFSDINSNDTKSVPNSVIPNLFSYFSNTVYSGFTDKGKGFYKVYSDVFDKIYANELNFCKKLGLRLESVREAPVMGNLESPYGQVTAFYNYWFSFITVMDFCWVDQYDVMAGPNRKSRRVMEEENKKLRNKAKREYNETVRGLARFVKKRDKRVIEMMAKRNVEMERKKAEERERRKEEERERMERVRAYEEPKWAQVNEEEVEGFDEDEEEGKDKEKEEENRKELYCVLCGKKFKSEKQWKNHEQSKKHKEKVAELRESFGDEEEERRGDFEEDVEEEGVMDENVEEMEDRFKEGFRIGDDGKRVWVEELSDEEDGFLDAEDGDEMGEIVEGGVNVVEEDDCDKETSVLEAMLSGRKNRKSWNSSHVSEDLVAEEVHAEDENEEVGVMEYDNQKSRRRRAKREKGKNNDAEAIKQDIVENRHPNKETNRNGDNEVEEFSSHSFVEKKKDGKSGNHLEKNRKGSNQSVNKKGAMKETNANSKNSSKGKKGKAAVKHSGNVCDTCGEQFESRSKLHKHLGATGHATLKFR